MFLILFCFLFNRINSEGLLQKKWRWWISKKNLLDDEIQIWQRCVFTHIMFAKGQLSQKYGSLLLHNLIHNRFLKRFIHYAAPGIKFREELHDMQTHRVDRGAEHGKCNVECMQQ